jgi:hypothetical protein
MARSHGSALVWLVALFVALAINHFGPVRLSAGAPARKTRAPVPKPKPRAEVIVIVSGYGSPARLFDTDGTYLGDLPFDHVYNCVLSPGGAQMAVVVPEVSDSNAGTGPRYSVYVERVGIDRKAVGKPLATKLKQPTLAWAGEGTLFITEHDNPPRGGGWLRPAGVSAYDVAKRTATADPLLQPYCIFGASGDGKRLLARRVVVEPAERAETVVLDAETRKPVDLGTTDITWTRFFGSDRLIGTRAKPKGAANETEYVIFDPQTKKAIPVGLPREIAGEPHRLFNVLPAPDGKRLLYCWTEEVPAPPDWSAKVPCQVARLTVADPDGRFGRTIFRPEIKERGDQTRNHIYTVDWK